MQAIAQWQRGIVAIGVRREPLSESVLIGTGFIVDMTAGIISTCAHVVLSAFYSNDGPLDPGVPGASGGYAIGVGIGERIQWICRADLRCISQPPASYAENLCSRCRRPQGPQTAPQQRRYKKQCVHCFALEHQQKQFLTGPPPSHWPVQDSAGMGALDLALLQLSDVSGQPLSEQTEPKTGLPVLTLWPRCLMDGRSMDLGLAPDHPRGLPIPAEAASPLLADLACALRLGHASTLQDGESFVMLGYGQQGTGTGQDQTSTTTRGHFSGSYTSSTTGVWYKTDVTILSGHSGGPVLNRRGEVIGWAVMSTDQLGQLRPVERLLDALICVLNKVAPGRPGATVRDQLLGHIPESERLELGDGATLEAAMHVLNEASEAAAQAQASAEQAASSRDDAAGQAVVAEVAATVARAAAGQASKAAEAAHSMLPHLLRVASAEDAERDYQRKRKAADDAADQADEAEALAQRKRKVVLTGANTGGPSCAAGTSAKRPLSTGGSGRLGGAEGGSVATSSLAQDPPLGAKRHKSNNAERVPSFATNTAQDRLEAAPAPNEMLVVISAPLVHKLAGKERPVPPLDQERELQGLIGCLRDANKALSLRAVFAQTDELLRMLTKHRPALLHFSGHVQNESRTVAQYGMHAQCRRIQ